MFEGRIPVPTMRDWLSAKKAIDLVMSAHNIEHFVFTSFMVCCTYGNVCTNLGVSRNQAVVQLLTIPTNINNIANKTFTSCTHVVWLQVITL